MGVIHVRNTVDYFLKSHGIPDNDFQLRPVFGLDDFLQEGGMSKDQAKRGAEFVRSYADEVALHLFESGRLLL